MPTAFHLFQDKVDKSEHTLEVDFMHAYDKSLTEEYTVNIILPEGASDIRVEIPSTCGIRDEDVETSKFFGTLDYFGRPKITIKKENAVHDLCDNVMIVRYQFNNSRDLYIEVVCMFGLLFSLYLAAMLYMRIGLTLDYKPKDKQKIY